MTDEPLSYLEISDACGLIRRQELSPVELARAALDRIDAEDDAIKAFVTRLDNQAIVDAQAAEKPARDGAQANTTFAAERGPVAQTSQGSPLRPDFDSPARFRIGEM